MTAAVKTAPISVYLPALCAIWIVSLAVSLVVPASWDVAWRLEITERLLAGSILYRDIIELNPPLWFWSALPSTFVAKVLNIPPFIMLCLSIHLVVSLALWLLDRLCAPLMTSTERMWLVAGAMIAMLLVPVNDIGQREPPVLLAGLLWTVLAVGRSKGIAFSPWLVVGVVLFSAYGFALKHYYLIVPIGIEIWLITKVKRAWRPIRLETVLLAVLGMVYALAIFKIAPNFLSDIVPLIGLSYDNVQSKNIVAPWIHPLKLLLLATVIVVPAYFMRDMIAKQPVAQVLFLTIIMHVFVVFIQGKGFENHFIAAKGTAFVMWALACGYACQSNFKFVLHPRAVLALLAVGWIAIPSTRHFESHLPAFAKASSAEGTASNATHTVIQTVFAEPRTSRIFIASTNAGMAFYLQWSHQRQHFSRYYAMWMFPGLLTSQLMPERAVQASAQLDLVRANTIADIQCAAPHLIIGDTTSHGRRSQTGFYAYDIKPMETLTVDKDFAAWLSANYTMKPEASGATVWRANQPTGPQPRKCPPKPR